MMISQQFKHTIPIQIRLNDIDILGHVNNSNIMEYFDLGKILYFKTLGINITPQDAGNLVIVHFEVDFHQQIFHDDTILVGTRTVKIGEKSIHIEQKVFSNTGVEKCTCRTVVAGFDAKQNCSIVIPENLKDTIRKFEGEVM